MAMRAQHAVWEAIADSFDRSRTRRWPHVEAWVDRLAPRSRVLDLMAGNGRHVASILGRGHTAVWADWSRPVARIAAHRYPEAHVAVCDATRLPFGDAAFDAVLWVAGLHSVPASDARAACLREAWRVLRPGGRMQLTVWSRDAPRFRDMGVAGQGLDVDIPWRAHGHDASRHYHLFTPGGLRADVERAKFAVDHEAAVAIVAPEPDNLVVEAHRPPEGRGPGAPPERS